MQTHLLEAGRSGPMAADSARVPETDLDRAALMFRAARPKLLRIALKVLESPAEAEDVVQEVWVGWQSTDRTVVLNPDAFLATVTTRLAINVSQSARRRHEDYVGTSLPDSPDPVGGPAAVAVRTEEVDFAVQLLLEKLTPIERAAFILRKAFDYPYRQIADLLHLGVANARQIVGRAQARIASDPRQTVDQQTRRSLSQALRAAAITGDVARLERLVVAQAVR